MSTTTTTSRHVLSLDVGTQSLKAAVYRVVRHDGNEAALLEQHSVNYDDGLTRNYGVRRGAKRYPDECVLAPSLMFFDALEVVLNKFSPHSLHAVEWISGGAQQHGFVRFDEIKASRALAALDADRTLLEQLEGVLTHEESPIWQDSSTSRECALMEAYFASDACNSTCRDVTGSSATERFTGPQIAKCIRLDGKQPWPRYQLISNAITSVLAGKLVACEAGDASGTNLLDIRTLKWSEAALRAVCSATDMVNDDANSIESMLEKLQKSLGQNPSPGGESFPLAPFFIARYGFPPTARVVSLTGDNLTLFESQSNPDDCVFISFGTSDTAFFALESASLPSEEHVEDGRHLFAHPFEADSGKRVLIFVFKSGASAREEAASLALSSLHKEELSEKSKWDAFDELLRKREDISQSDQLLCYSLLFDQAEITPRTARGGARMRGDLTHPIGKASHSTPALEAVSVIQSRLVQIKMRLDRATRANARRRPRQIVFGGGPSESDEIMKMAADIFGAPVRRAGHDGAVRGGMMRVINFLLHKRLLEEGGRDKRARLVEDDERATLFLPSPRPYLTSAQVDKLCELVRRGEEEIVRVLS